MSIDIAASGRRQDHAPARRRRLLLAAVLLAPPVAAAVALAAVEIARLIRPASALAGEFPAPDFGTAIARRFPVEEVYRFVRGGADPDEPIAVEDPETTGGRRVVASPLTLAVAAREPDVVQMLVDYGARVDQPQNVVAWCLADALGDDAVLAILARARAARREPPVADGTLCAAVQPKPGSPPLTWITAGP